MSPTLLERLLIPQLRRPAQPPAPGLYPFNRAIDDEHTVRTHLRVDPDGGGLLVVNATACARLTPSGVLIAHGCCAARTRPPCSRRCRPRSATQRRSSSATTSPKSISCYTNWPSQAVVTPSSTWTIPASVAGQPVFSHPSRPTCPWPRRNRSRRCWSASGRPASPT